jgi:hypothetical protein
MRRAAALLLLLTVGCSTAPVADLMDHFHPSPAGGPIAVAKIPPQPAVVVAPPVIARPPSGALPVITPGAPQMRPDPKPPVPEPEPLPPPQTVPEGVVPARFPPRPEPKKSTPPVTPPRPEVAPAIFRYQMDAKPPPPASLPSAGVSLPR